MRTALLGLLVAAAFAASGLGLALYIGAGVLRQGAPALVALSAGCLVLLPAMGLASAQRRWAGAMPLGLAVWSLALMAGFPLYFPGERAEALATGIGVLGAPFGLRLDAAPALRLNDAIPSAPEARPPAPPAVPLLPTMLPPSLALGADQVALPYEGQGRTLSLPVTFEGPRGAEAEAWMLFDTGATLTTLNEETLADLGVHIPPDAPEITVHTAAGDRQTRLVVVDRVWIGGMVVEGVTVSVCDPCADDEHRGLLGLNVSGRFLVTLDPARQELLLSPRGDEVNRVLDVAPWLRVAATAATWPDGRVEVTVEATNRGSRSIAEADVALKCSETFVAEVRDVAPGERRQAVVSLPRGTDCNGYTVTLERADW